jgi:hypothetical protein
MGVEVAVIVPDDVPLSEAVETLPKLLIVPRQRRACALACGS